MCYDLQSPLALVNVCWGTLRMHADVGLWHASAMVLFCDGGVPGCFVSTRAPELQSARLQSVKSAAQGVGFSTAAFVGKCAGNMVWTCTSVHQAPAAWGGGGRESMLLRAVRLISQCSVCICAYAQYGHVW
jgi:hypothetical protein